MTPAEARRTYQRQAPKRPSRWTETYTAVFLALWRDGTPLDLLGALFDLTPAAVCQRAAILRARGLDVPRRRRVLA